MPDIGKLEARLTADNKQLKARLEQSEKMFKNYARDAERATSRAEKSFKSSSMGIGRSLGVMAVGLVAVRTAMDIVQTGAKFEQTMAKVGAVTNATEQEFADLSAQARKMGETTEFSATQAAEGLAFLGKAGFSATKAIKALPGVLNLATAGELDLGRAADIVSNALTAMRLPVEELNRVNDVFSATITSANTDMNMLAESFKFAAPLAAGFGFEIEEVSGLIGLLGNAGIQGSMAGTQLAFAMQNLDKAFEALGISATKQDGSMKGLVDVLAEMEKQGTSTMEIVDIFGARGGRAMLALKGVGVEAVRAYIKELDNAEGSTDRLSNTMRDTFIGDLKVLKSVLESVKIDAFNDKNKELRQTLQDMAKTVRDNKESIIEFFNGLITVMNGVATAALGVSKAIGWIPGWASDTGKAMGLVNAGFLTLEQVAAAGTPEKLRQLVSVFDEMSDTERSIQMTTNRLNDLNDTIEKMASKQGKQFLVFQDEKDTLAALRKEASLVEKQLTQLEGQAAIEIAVGIKTEQEAIAAAAVAEDSPVIDPRAEKERIDAEARAAEALLAQQRALNEFRLEQEDDYLKARALMLEEAEEKELKRIEDQKEAITQLETDLKNNAILTTQQKIDQVSEIESRRLAMVNSAMNQEGADFERLEKLKTQITKDATAQRTAIEKAAADEKKAQINKAIGQFGELFQAFSGHSKKMQKAAQAAAIAQALINTHEGATKALAQGGFYGFAMAAAVVASGMAQIANIRSAGSGGGSTASVSGGGGGVSGSTLASVQSSVPDQAQEQGAAPNITIKIDALDAQTFETYLENGGAQAIRNIVQDNKDDFGLVQSDSTLASNA